MRCLCALHTHFHVCDIFCRDVADVHAQQNNNSKFINWINATITDNTSVLLTNLEPYTNYMFIVRALVTTGDREKMGPPSEILKLHTPEDSKSYTSFTYSFFSALSFSVMSFFLLCQKNLYVLKITVIKYRIFSDLT